MLFDSSKGGRGLALGICSLFAGFGGGSLRCCIRLGDRGLRFRRRDRGVLQPSQVFLRVLLTDQLVRQDRELVSSLLGTVAQPKERISEIWRTGGGADAKQVERRKPRA